MRRPLLIMVAGVVTLAATVAGGVAVASAAVTPTKTVTITSSACAGKKEYCFKPAALVVTKGTKVIWKNASSAPHTVTRCTKKLCGVSGGTGTDPKLSSPMINGGKTYSFTFHHAGTYVYFCTVHGYFVMHGTVTVH